MPRCSFLPILAPQNGQGTEHASHQLEREIRHIVCDEIMGPRAPLPYARGRASGATSPLMEY